MKKILYTLYLLCAFFACSCTQELAENNTAVGQEAGTISLTLRSVEASTKATMPGEDIYNENLIKSVHYFFYPKDGTTTNTEKQPAKEGQYTNLSKLNQHTMTINASEDEIKNVLFKYPYNDCDVYVIVNLPSNIKLEELPDHKLSTLKNIVLEASFNANLTQPCFVMEGLNVATVEDRNKVLAAKGTVPVDRVASKISVSIDVDERLDLQTPPDTPDNETSGMIWTSNPEKMIIEFVNGVNRTVLSGNPDNIELIDSDRFTVTHSVPEISDGEPQPESWTCEPFYTYPTKWEIGSDEEPYLFITLPWTTIIWTSVDGQKPPIYKTYPCYYKIMLGSDELKRNTWYDLKINIGMLGSFENTPEVILPIEGTQYFVADWSTGLNVDSEILGARYLVVDKAEYKLYNQTTLTIPFTTSHECEIVDAECTYPKLNVNPATTATVDKSQYTLDIVGGNTIQFSHALNNDMLSTNLDFTPFTITLTLQHSDDDAYKKEIKIIQYPAIYAEAFDNTDYKNGGQANADNGFVWVNGYQGNSTRPSGGDYFGGAGGNSRSADPRMLVFTITTTEGTDFVIGDPRDTDYTYDESSANWYSAPAAAYDKNSNRELKYYYGTAVASSAYNTTTQSTIYANDEAAEAAEPTINMIAPKFRLSSGYGTVTETTGAKTLEIMKKRCAAYQEDGYPAGRWRLPTRAEFQFIYTQICYEKLPEVYFRPQTTANMSYWCAHGLGTPNNNGLVQMSYIGYYNGNNTTPVRCVYDEWYWENSNTYRLGNKNADGSFTPSDTFTWGDMPRDQFDAKTE